MVDLKSWKPSLGCNQVVGWFVSKGNVRSRMLQRFNSIGPQSLGTSSRCRDRGLRVAGGRVRRRAGPAAPRANRPKSLGHGNVRVVRLVALAVILGLVAIRSFFQQAPPPPNLYVTVSSPGAGRLSAGQILEAQTAAGDPTTGQPAAADSHIQPK